MLDYLYHSQPTHPMSTDNPTGRPPVYDEPMTLKQVKLPEHLVEHAREVGDGNMSAGIRACIERDRQSEYSAGSNDPSR